MGFQTAPGCGSTSRMPAGAVERSPTFPDSSVTWVQGEGISEPFSRKGNFRQLPHHAERTRCRCLTSSDPILPTSMPSRLSEPRQPPMKVLLQCHTSRETARKMDGQECHAFLSACRPSSLLDSMRRSPNMVVQYRRQSATCSKPHWPQNTARNNNNVIHFDQADV